VFLTAYVNDIFMKTPSCIRLAVWRIPVGLALSLLVSIASAATGHASIKTVMLDEAKANYPTTCSGADRGITGVCLLASVKPRAHGSFQVRSVSHGQTGAKVMPLTLNTVLPLAPGAYQIYWDTGSASRAIMPVNVADGQVTTILTATLDTRALPLTLVRGGAQPVGGCVDERVGAGVLAIFPGNYLLKRVDVNGRGTLKCGRGGTAFNALGGQAFRASAARLKEQTLTAQERYIHPNKVSALTTVAPYNHGITQLGWIRDWRVFRGIQNPLRKLVGGLALFGPGSFTYIVPFSFDHRATKVCGRSLALGGMAALPLLTQCQFKKGRLTKFTVNVGNFVTYHNLHGLSDVAAARISTRFTVENVQFTPVKRN
jgi:hypothetical protein